jgi:putative transposase
MLLYRRRLPHWIPDNKILFLTWRLAGSPPPPRPAFLTAANTGRTTSNRHPIPAPGPTWLTDPRIAAIVQNALHHGETARQLYTLYAWVVMSNHVHVVFEPKAPLPEITRWLKGRTARTANRILGRIGTPFWQDESYDHWIRSSQELQQIVTYVESNPINAKWAR